MKEYIKRKMEATEMDALRRRTARISKLHRIRNEDIKKRMDIGRINHRTHRKETGSLVRTCSENDRRKITEESNEMGTRENRRRKRPRRTWIEGVRRSTSSRELNDVDCCNKGQWRLGIGNVAGR